MTRYVYRPDHPKADEFGMIDASTALPKVADPKFYVISDEMDATRHMANGKHYTSKAAFRQATKDAGCIEVGNEVSTLLKPRKQVTLSRADRREAIRQTIRQLRGY